MEYYVVVSFLILYLLLIVEDFFFYISLDPLVSSDIKFAHHVLIKYKQQQTYYNVIFRLYVYVTHHAKRDLIGTPR